MNSTLEQLFNDTTHISLRWIYRSAKIYWTKKPIWVYSSSPLKRGRNNKFSWKIKLSERFKFQNAWRKRLICVTESSRNNKHQRHSWYNVQENLGFLPWRAFNSGICVVYYFAFLAHGSWWQEDLSLLEMHLNFPPAFDYTIIFFRQVSKKFSIMICGWFNFFDVVIRAKFFLPTKLSAWTNWKAANVENFVR